MIGKVDAVVLAGEGGLKDPSGPADAVQNKALLPIGSRVMVDYVLSALRNCPEISHIALVGPDLLRTIYKDDPELIFASPGKSPLSSFSAGVAALRSRGNLRSEGKEADSWVLACTGDIPFLTPEAVKDFLNRCRERQADFYYPIVPREVAEHRFPEVMRTYVRLRDGSFTGGNLFLLNMRVLEACLDRAEEFIRLRKKPAALARLVGFKILWKYLFRVLSIHELEERVFQLYNIRGAAVISSYPEIGVDVDKASDLELARRYFASPNN